MSRQLEVKDFKKAVEFISKLSGFPATIVSFIIRAYSTFVLLELYQGHTIHLPLLGKLTPKKGRTANADFRPSNRLKRFLYLNKDVDLRSIIEGYKTYLQDPSKKEVLEKHHTYSHEVIKKTSINVKYKDLKRYLKQEDALRIHFLRYLQKEFIHELPWRHPYRKEEVYSHDRIKKKIIWYRSLDPDGYALLYSLWLGVGKRNTVLKELHLTPQEVEELIHEVLNSLLLLIIYPDLEPEGLEVMHRMGLLGISSV